MSEGPRIELGDGVSATLRICECTDPACDHSKPCGMTFEHTTPSGVACEAGSWIRFGVGEHAWSLECVDPLTISPSLLCTRCGRHGFVRFGKWIPA